MDDEEDAFLEFLLKDIEHGNVVNINNLLIDKITTLIEGAGVEDEN